MKEKLEDLKDKPGKSSKPFTVKFEYSWWTGREGIKKWNEFWQNEFKKHINEKSKT